MQVILLERVEKLGQMGDEVRVKDGFARNFLLPKKKALRATKANREYFQTRKVDLEAHNLERRKDAEAVAKKLDGKSFILIRQAGDRGQLYGSVSPRDVAVAMEQAGMRDEVVVSRRVYEDARDRWEFEMAEGLVGDTETYRLLGKRDTPAKPHCSSAQGAQA